MSGQGGVQFVNEPIRRYPSVTHAGFWALFAVLIVLSIVVSVLAHNNPLLPGDAEVASAVHAVRGPVLGPLMLGLTTMWMPLWSVAIIAVAAIAAWALGRHVTAVFILLTITSSVVASLVKLLVGRPRPEPFQTFLISPLNDNSFPSGHAFDAIVFFGFIAFVVWPDLRTWWQKAVVLGVLMVLVVATGMSRVYFGVHWPSDVLGGFILGAAWLMVLVWGFRQAVRRYRRL